MLCAALHRAQGTVCVGNRSRCASDASTNGATETTVVALCVQCLAITVMLLYLSTPEQLTACLREVPFAAFVKSLLSEADDDAVTAALLITELLMAKAESEFAPQYVKQGASEALRKVAVHAPTEPAASAASSLERVCAVVALAGVSRIARVSSTACRAQVLCHVYVDHHGTGAL